MLRYNGTADRTNDKYSVTLRYNATCDRAHLFVSWAYLSYVRDIRSMHHSHDDIQDIMMPNQAQVKPRLI